MHITDSYQKATMCNKCRTLVPTYHLPGSQVSTAAGEEPMVAVVESSAAQSFKLTLVLEQVKLENSIEGPVSTLQREDLACDVVGC